MKNRLYLRCIDVHECVAVVASRENQEGSCRENAKNARLIEVDVLHNLVGKIYNHV